MSNITGMLEAARQGDLQASEALLPLVYDEPPELAAAKMALQAPGQTLQPTALVHEAWLKLAGNTSKPCNDRQHFFRAAAEAMGQILIDRARAKHRIKRGAGSAPLNLEELEVAAEAAPEALLVLDEALELLAREHPDKAELVNVSGRGIFPAAFAN